jgi:hypothetical protein
VLLQNVVRAIAGKAETFVLRVNGDCYDGTVHFNPKFLSESLSLFALYLFGFSCEYKPIEKEFSQVRF